MDISHTLAGASDEYVVRYFRELPRTFRAPRFDPRDWASLAQLSGFRYVVFTAKHHNGFCMFHTRTTDYHVGNAPLGIDVVREVLSAFRDYGLSPGLYFSPDDFRWLWDHGIPIQREVEAVTPSANPGLMQLAQAQVSELLSEYGDVDTLFFDGPAAGLREHAWRIRPELVVTRGAIPTPEQRLLDEGLDAAWEACLTLGTQWSYKPTNEVYKSGADIIRTLIETRAKGGNLLLNVGPGPDGTIPGEQVRLLQELGLWMFVNGESIYATRPWTISHEGPLWLTYAPRTRALYVHVTDAQDWAVGSSRRLTLTSVRASAETEVSVLGQNGTVVEYRPDQVAPPSWTQDSAGLHLEATNTQRMYTDRTWPNPLVIKLTDIAPTR